MPDFQIDKAGVLVKNHLMMSHSPTELNQDQKTALYDVHVGMGAKMVPFAGWQMPLQYGKVLDEHHAVRSAAGLFDISHMGLVALSCGETEATRQFLETLVPQNLSKLFPGKSIYTQFLNEQGGIIDDIIITMMPDSERFSRFQEFLVVCNAANTQRDMDWLRQHAQAAGLDGLNITLLSGEYSLFALQGPLFQDTLTRTGYHCDRLPKRFQLNEGEIQGIPVLLSRTGYTGEDGVELILPSAEAPRLWNLLLDLGRPIGLKPVGLGARDTLRLEAAYPLHGHDISENDTPLQAGLGWSVKLDKSVDFIGKAALLHQREHGLEREFYCFTINKRTIARQHDMIVKDGQPIGEVTSGSISPLFNVPIGMGYIRTGAISGPGDVVQIRVRGTDVDAEIVERPFYES